MSPDAEFNVSKPQPFWRQYEGVGDYDVDRDDTRLLVTTPDDSEGEEAATCISVSVKVN